MLANLSEDERQVILLALAHLAVERPGWEHCLTLVSRRLGGEALFRELHANRRQGPPLARVPDPPGTARTMHQERDDA